MLQTLTIKNYALIEALDVNFTSGFTTITGETGAGKSILLGGLSLILGKRADLSSLRHKDKKCILEATFNIENYALKSFFKSEDLDYEALTIIRREILPSGKSRAFINDTPVTLSVLNQLGAYLVDIHSQNETRELVDEQFQFKVIDALANNKKPIVQYKEELKNYKALLKALKVHLEAQAIAVKEYDYNLFLFNELDEAKLEQINLEQLEQEYDTLNNVETILENAQETHQLLNDESVGLYAGMSQLKLQVSKLAQLSKHYEPVSTRVESIFIELDDITNELDALKEDLQASPDRLEVISQQLSDTENLFKKHSVNTIEDLIQIKNELDQKVIDTEGLDAEIEATKAKIEASKETLSTFALDIHNRREKAIPVLVKKLEALLALLGMPNARFQVGVNSSDSFYTNGADDLSFLFSANKGMDFNLLKKAASGGELSRIMLSIKAILSQYVKLPTIMFDEIDTGVSGEIAHKMGDIMAKMSKNMQVFSITHLPQIASKGVSHYKVYKETVNDTTITNLVQLNKDERVNEIALMLGGSDLQDSALAHAKQLLS